VINRLSIKNYALIEESEIDFESGFTAITGETGAGKSILLGALSLLLGARADRSILRNPSKKCFVEGVFTVNEQIRNSFTSFEIEKNEPVILRREISSDGKSRAFINDSQVTIQVLKELSTKLIHLNLQKENIRFLSSEYQIEALDAFAQNDLQRNQYFQAYQTWKSLENELRKSKTELAKRTKEKEFNQYRLEELEMASLTNENELNELESEFKRLDQSADIIRFLIDLDQVFDGNVSNQIHQLNQQGNRFKEFGPDLSELSVRLNGIYLEVKDFAQDAHRMLANFEMDPQRLDVVEQRISQLYKLLKKFQVQTISELLLEKNQLVIDLQEDGQLEDRIHILEKEVKISFSHVEKAADELTNSRKSAVEEFETKLKKIFPWVQLPHAFLKVNIDSLMDYSDDYSGKDEVSFWFNANPGMELQPLDQIASGGELSRITLVIKSLISEKAEMPTLVFDEVDSGISGEAAFRVGELLKKLSGLGQVVAITHLPQIAAQAPHHLQVEKQIKDEKTITFIEKVEGEKRIGALVKMLGGNESGDTLKKYAQELLVKSKN
jgi:DNA repair protein RecN (Recombination protein N)